MKYNCIILIFLFLSVSLSAQMKSNRVKAENTKAVFLGKSKPISELIKKERISPNKKGKFKSQRKKPDNFKYRRGHSKVTRPDLEHQGSDPIRQFDFQKSNNSVEPIVNKDGIFSSFGSPNDPTGDVGIDYYVQAINATAVGIFDKEGIQVEEFSMNTLWTEFGVQSLGDPIILFDEVASRWILTEFTGPANLLIAISETSNPLGSYSAYNFSTPNFPDYPKYSIWPNALVVTTNEGGAGVLHQYFIDRVALLAGDDTVTIQRIEVTGNTNTEAGFFVTTPVDWNGIVEPSDSRPITMSLNDSSWGNVPEDAIELYHFDIDWVNPDNTKVFNTSIVTTPYDSYPCSSNGTGFSCVQQPGVGADGLDAIPEVIMNLPHYRHFGTHESIVLSFVTDVTNGQNLSGVRWVELQKTNEEDWQLYQEGTIAPDDGLDRYMSSIAIDKNGNIAVAYNVSSLEEFVGMRFTGRFATDPLGEMTIEEFNVVDGGSEIESFGRFGDYAQMNIDPTNGSTFWYTGEYAGSADARTRLLAFELSKDTFDLDVTQVQNPISGDNLTAEELLTVVYKNTGLQAITNFNVGYDFEGQTETVPIFETLEPDSTFTHQFSQFLDMSEVRSYSLKTFISDELDTNFFNDTLRAAITHFPVLEVGLVGGPVAPACGETIFYELEFVNNGTTQIESAEIEVLVDGNLIETIPWQGRLGFRQSTTLEIELDLIEPATYQVVMQLNRINGDLPQDMIASDNQISFPIEVNNADGAIGLSVFTDNFPGETTWELVAIPSGDIIATGGPYTEGMTRIRENFCLEVDSCYTFTIFDALGDGLCCFGGQGFYEITDVDGTTLVFSEGNFDFEESNTFCVGLFCNIQAEIEITNASSATAEDGAILLTARDGIEPYMYSIDRGQTFQESGLFENLDAGPYFIIIASRDNVCIFEDTVILRVGSVSTADTDREELKILVKPNPSDGFFNVEVSNHQLTEVNLTAQIYDSTGRLLQARKMPKYGDTYKSQFSLVDSPNGNYYLRFKSPQINKMIKIVKQ